MRKGFIKLQRNDPSNERLFDPLASSCLWFFPARAWPSSYRYNNYRCFSWWL